MVGQKMVCYYKYIDEIIEMGVDVLDPVQPINELARWNKDYHRKVIFMGALNAQDVIDNPMATEEDIKNEVHSKINLFSQNGYFIPFSVSLSPRVMDALDECFIYGRTFYNENYKDDVEAFILQKQKMLQESGHNQSIIPGTSTNLDKN